MKTDVILEYGVIAKEIELEGELLTVYGIRLLTKSDSISQQLDIENITPCLEKAEHLRNMFEQGGVTATTAHEIVEDFLEIF